MSFSSHEQVLIVQNNLVSGVASADLGYQTQTEPLYVAGMGYMDNFISGPTEGQMNISRYLLGPDFIRDIADDEMVSGGLILNNGQSVGFTRARLLNYQVSCNVGQVPEIQNTFKVYGNLGGGVSPIGRWNESKSDYDLDDLVSMPNKNNGFSEDMVYKCIEYGTRATPGDKDSGGVDLGWEKLSENPVQGTLEAKKLLEQQSKMQDREYVVPTQGSIKIKFQGTKSQDVAHTLSEFPGYNAILGFNYSRGLDLDSLYALRNEQLKGAPLTDYEAIDVQIIYPIKSTFDFTVSFDNYRLSDMRAFLDYANWDKGRIEQDISIEIRDPQNLEGDPVVEYTVKRAKLLSEAIVSQTGEETTLNISFEGYERDDLINEPWFLNSIGDSPQGDQDTSDGEEYKIESVET